VLFFLVVVTLFTRSIVTLLDGQALHREHFRQRQVPRRSRTDNRPLRDANRGPFLDEVGDIPLNFSPHCSVPCRIKRSNGWRHPDDSD